MPTGQFMRYTMTKTIFYGSSIILLGLVSCEKKATSLNAPSQKDQIEKAAITELQSAPQKEEIAQYLEYLKANQSSQSDPHVVTEPVTLVAAEADTDSKAIELPPEGEPLSFNTHVQPVLSVNCYHCHGPDSGSRMPEKNPLRLDNEKDAFTPRENGKPVIIKGKPDESYLVELIESKNKDHVMPPHPEKHPLGKILKPQEIAILRRWVAEGAKYEAHWSFIPPKKATPPSTELDSWARNPIDKFIAKRMLKAGLKPNDQEEKSRLLRRLHLDLTGLPPEPKAMEQLLADTRDFDTVYLETVDKLLNSQAYAEHWGRHWLDVARYGDTHGIHFDNYRSIWPYRDWVFKAFKKNMPFDQFTIEQIAGDLLPKPTQEQIVATGFNRCLPTTGEGGAIDEEYYAIYAQDRVDTTAAAWLGLTTGCAACHDHKFDPISMKENYQLTAFFRNTTMQAMDLNHAHHPPNIRVKTPHDLTRLTELEPKIAEVKTKLEQHIKANGDQFKQWHSKKQRQALKPSKPLSALVVKVPFDNKKTGLTDSLGNKHKANSKVVSWVESIVGSNLHLTKNNSIDLGALESKVNMERNQAVSFSAWIKLPHGVGGSPFAKMNPGNGFRGYDTWLENNRIAAHFIHKWPENHIKVVAKTPYPHDKWFHLTLTYDGSSKAQGVKIYYDGDNIPLDVVADTLTESIQTKVPLQIGARENATAVPNLSITDFRVYDRVIYPEEIAKISKERFFNSLLAHKEPNEKQTKHLSTHYFDHVDDVSKQLKMNLSSMQHQVNSINQRSPVTLVMEEKKDDKPFAYILNRGNYSEKTGDKLSPGVPAVLPGLDDLPGTRLGLAKWLVKENNPLSSRVTVNRYWYYIFGKGIVKTTGDFGIMGARPSHPQLLDWLAVDFVENGWDFHHLLRTIVTSATYRQSAKLTDKKLDTDPENLLLARGPRYRLDAEQIRDLALKSSGLLHDQLGGPSVRPYQPEFIWEAVAMPGSNTRFYRPDAGNNLYRRSVYTFWKRSAPHPTMEIFNAPTREVTCVQRELTNTPLQAFVVMNDPQFVEASRHLAERAILRAKTPEERINFIAMSILSREMSKDEHNIVMQVFEKAKEKFSSSKEDAKKLISVGASKADESIPPEELAAWTLVSSQILNMDEALNK